MMNNLPIILRTLGHLQATSRPPPGHLQVTYRPPPGHLSALATTKLGLKPQLSLSFMWPNHWPRSQTVFSGMVTKPLTGPDLKQFSQAWSPNMMSLLAEVPHLISIICKDSIYIFSNIFTVFAKYASMH